MATIGARVNHALAFRGDVAMIGREFRKRLRLLQGRSETITTRHELDKAGRLVEHISVETHDGGSGAHPNTRLMPINPRKDPVA
jgi:hypothetical protein